MKSSVLFKTKFGNYYLFDRRLKTYTSIPQKAFEIYSYLENKSNNVKRNFDSNDFSYYKNKYYWLKEQGFFGLSNVKSRFSGKINKENIKEQ